MNLNLFDSPTSTLCTGAESFTLKNCSSQPRGGLEAAPSGAVTEPLIIRGILSNARLIRQKEIFPVDSFNKIWPAEIQMSMASFSNVHQNIQNINQFT